MIHPDAVYACLDCVEEANLLPVNVDVNASVPGIPILIVSAAGP